LIYLQANSDSPAYLRELRLQNLESLSLEALRCYAGLYLSPKVQRAAEMVARLAEAEAREYQVL
jgi:hypothetical protein